MQKKTKILLGGLGSTGRKAEKIKSYYADIYNEEVEIDKLMPDYVNDKPNKVLKEIDGLLQNSYDCIYASSTGCLYLLSSLANSDFEYETKVGLINPLLFLTKERQQVKDQAFLSNVLPLMKMLTTYDYRKTNLNFVFHLSREDEVIGSQIEMINSLNFFKNKKVYFYEDNHRMSKSMNKIISIMKESHIINDREVN